MCNTHAQAVWRSGKGCAGKRGQAAKAYRPGLRLLLLAHVVSPLFQMQTCRTLVVVASVTPLFCAAGQCSLELSINASGVHAVFCLDATDLLLQPHAFKLATAVYCYEHYTRLFSLIEPILRTGLNLDTARCEMYDETDNPKLFPETKAIIQACRWAALTVLTEYWP